jgi:outer membrane lipoprotein
MKRMAVLAVSLFLAACAPVLDRELIEQGERNVSLNELRRNPGAHKGKLYILGGVIVETRFVQNGSRVEVLSYPVDSRGSLEYRERSEGRFWAILPEDKGLLDPVVYEKGRRVTLAGVFLDTRTGKIDDREYAYPVFEIRQIHLWDESEYITYPYYPYYSPHPYWSYPYRYYPYWGPWGPPPPGWW